jgi:hypothetical protein
MCVCAVVAKRRNVVLLGVTVAVTMMTMAMTTITMTMTMIIVMMTPPETLRG